MELSDGVRSLRERVAKACADVGRREDEIVVIAATKTVPVERINELRGYGITDVGENRVQEFLTKYTPSTPLKWHIIGALQSNKVKSVVGKAALIQSVDRISLADEIDKISARENVVSEVLIEINACGEMSKSGVSPGSLDELASYVGALKNVRLKGIMSVPPVAAEYKTYELIYKLYENTRKKHPEADILSLGMSGDFETAIKCGSNMIRIGRALFGERTYV